MGKLCLYGQYIKTRENRDIIYYEEAGERVGFVTYQFTNHKSGDPICYMVDMFLSEGKRMMGAGVWLLKQVEQKALENDVQVVYTSCDVSTNNADKSMKVILHHGFKPEYNDGNVCYFRKVLEV